MISSLLHQPHHLTLLYHWLHCSLSIGCHLRSFELYQYAMHWESFVRYVILLILSFLWLSFSFHHAIDAIDYHWCWCFRADFLLICHLPYAAISTTSHYYAIISLHTPHFDIIITISHDLSLSLPLSLLLPLWDVLISIWLLRHY